MQTRVWSDAPALEWWQIFEDKQLEGSRSAGRRAARLTAAEPWARAAAYANFQNATLEINEYWAGISGPK